jgi:hypothetical protein
MELHIDISDTIYLKHIFPYAHVTRFKSINSFLHSLRSFTIVQGIVSSSNRNITTLELLQIIQFTSIATMIKV